VKIRLINQSDTKKQSYTTWRGKMFSLERDFATATDNFDNVLKRIDFGFGTDIVGAVDESESIYPGKSLEDILVFEVPVAAVVNWNCRGATSGPKTIRLTCDWI
jgi:hypothetical protein